RALLAYACGDYAACVRGLIRVRDCASLWRKPCSVRLDPSDLHRGQRCGRERCRAERCATSERARGQEGKTYNVWTRRVGQGSPRSRDKEVASLKICNPPGRMATQGHPRKTHCCACGMPCCACKFTLGVNTPRPATW